MTDTERYSVDSELDGFPFNSFDPADETSWHFGDLTREQVVQLLMPEPDGVFCIRESSTQQGSLVLSVKESGNQKSSPISHYLIRVTHSDDKTPATYDFGDQVFLSMAQLLKYYMTHYLESTCLVRPAKRAYTKMIAKYDFVAQEEGDLSFKKNELLHVAQKKVDISWWMARNVLGQSGLIPCNYVEEYPNSGDESSRNSMSSVTAENVTSLDSNNNSGAEQQDDSFDVSTIKKKPLPAYARAKMARVPNAYDKTALRLEVNDRIKVLKTDDSGTWEGELNGKVGFFPFTYVEWEDDESSSLTG